MRDNMQMNTRVGEVCRQNEKITRLAQGQEECVDDGSSSHSSSTSMTSRSVSVIHKKTYRIGCRRGRHHDVSGVAIVGTHAGAGNKETEHPQQQEAGQREGRAAGPHRFPARVVVAMHGIHAWRGVPCLFIC